MNKWLFLTIFLLSAISLAPTYPSGHGQGRPGIASHVEANGNLTIVRPVSRGISITAFRLNRTAALPDSGELDKQLTDSVKLDLGEMSGDLLMVLTNSTDPFSDNRSVPYLMVYGRSCFAMTRYGTAGGFIPSSEIAKITSWIKNNRIDTFEGFSKKYDSLSGDVKAELKAWGSPTSEELFKWLVKPLTAFYLKAQENKNAVVLIGS